LQTDLLKNIFVHELFFKKILRRKLVWEMILNVYSCYW
jgi:hypothetical protein